MSTINENQKKLKCFYKEGTYEGKEYDTKCNYIGKISFSMKYEFDKGYLLVTRVGTDATEKYYLNGTALIGPGLYGNLIENWCINKNKLYKTTQDTNEFGIYKSIIEKKANNVYKLLSYTYNKDKNKYVFQGYSTVKFIK